MWLWLKGSQTVHRQLTLRRTTVERVELTKSKGRHQQRNRRLHQREADAEQNSRVFRGFIASGNLPVGKYCQRPCPTIEPMTNSVNNSNVQDGNADCRYPTANECEQRHSPAASTGLRNTEQAKYIPLSSIACHRSTTVAGDRVKEQKISDERNPKPTLRRS